MSYLEVPDGEGMEKVVFQAWMDNLGGVFARLFPSAGAWLVLCFVVCGVAAERSSDIPIVISRSAPSAERSAADELAAILGRLYPKHRFTPAAELPRSGRCIVIGSDAATKQWVAASTPTAPESFCVTTLKQGGREMGVIAGADARGTAYGVYALLEKLGCGFYLSGNTLPAAGKEPFSFAAWQLADRPLARERLVFDWHNFLSGCSTWNLEDWNRWTDQSRKMRFNAIMVHAYGNNPMVSFTFNGKTKPVGYLSTTAKGRDWSTQHANDARRLFGGEVFESPVFGAEAALVPDEQRAASAQALMHDVFSHAAGRGMEVYFANDVDTASANPQDLILTLPEEARFKIQTTGLAWMGQDAAPLWLANPDSREGYQYYKAQAQALMSAYPDITTLVAWFRIGGTPWMEIKVSEMPQPWRREWEAEVARTPAAAKMWHGPQVFALGKIVRAWGRALQELGHQKVQLAAGTWDFKFLEPCDRFFPPDVKLIGLDYNVLHDHPQLADAASRKVLQVVGSHRAVIPVIWAHHDDGNYIGRPYTPFLEFNAKLADANASGFGIIHWTTRPLDLFFTSHARQVWEQSVNEPLATSCDEMALRYFGEPARGAMKVYLERWISDAPKFARETTDYFIDRQLTNITEVIAGCRGRLKMLESAERQKLTHQQRERLLYYKGMEQFMASFHEAHGRFQSAQLFLKKGDRAAARQAIADCRPEPVIEQFAAAGSKGGITRGEQGLVVSLNTRWLPHIVSLRQQLALEPVRYRFGATSHDKLAQARGTFSFYFDANRTLWQTFGSEETGAATFELPPNSRVTRTRAIPKVAEEICRTGIQTARPVTLALKPIVGKSPLPAGKYRVALWMLDPSSTASGQNVFRVSVAGAPEEVVDVFQQTSKANSVLEKSWDVTLTAPGAINIKVNPERGEAVLCAATVTPID